MRVAVAGGTGLVGRHIVGELRAAGHEPVVLARSTGVDVTTGQGLADALAGVGAVIDVTNTQTLSRRKAVAFFEAASRRLLAAEERAGVRHHVVLSIVGIERAGHPVTATTRGKIRQEQVVAAGPVPWTVLRATQFHEFADQLLDGMPGPPAVIPRMRVQPVAVREAARALAELAEGPAQGMAPELAGPVRSGSSTWSAACSPPARSAASCCRSATRERRAERWRAAACSPRGRARAVCRRSTRGWRTSAGETGRPGEVSGGVSVAAPGGVSGGSPFAVGDEFLGCSSPRAPRPQGGRAARVKVRRRPLPRNGRRRPPS
jgi:hypothetical protein